MGIILLFFTPYGVSESQLPDSCVSTYFDEKVEVNYVVDGDTVVLEDNRHIRLIGINTPELGRDNRPDETGAEQAKLELERLLNTSKIVGLNYDIEQFDRHGRTLAHLYLEVGTNIQALMLEDGLAIPLTIPPNFKHLDCYTEKAKTARTAQRGLWALDKYKARHVHSLAGKERGFNFIFGKVERVTESRSAIWINLENNVSLRIIKDDLKYFNHDALKSFAGNIIEAKGWLYKKKGQLRMRIRHPLDINIINLSEN